MTNRPSDRLKKLADLYEDRNKLYGNNYKKFGDMMTALFPGGLNINEKEDWNRIAIFVLICSKVSRYGERFYRGGHEDSLDDISVYAQMLQELDHE